VWAWWDAAFEKASCLDLVAISGLWPLHLLVLVLLLQILVVIIHDTRRAGTDFNADRMRRICWWSTFPKSLDTCSSVHIRPREPGQTAQLLHRHLQRQVLALRHARYDLCHGLAAASLDPGNWPRCRTHV
jgi:hypothetical protein